MYAASFLKTAVDPEQWLRKSAALRRAAHQLWETFFEYWIRGGLRHGSFGYDEEKTVFAHPADYMTSAKFMYGFSLESAFKPNLPLHRPEDIEFKLSADGTGVIQSAQ